MPRESTGLIALGAFLVLCGIAGWGLAGFAARAKTAIIFGGASGLVLIVLGIVGAQGAEGTRTVVRYLGAIFAVLFAIAFGVRAIMSWRAVASGEPRLYLALILSMMSIACLTAVVMLLSRWRTSGG